jgi:hypothetical protein
VPVVVLWLGVVGSAAKSTQFQVGIGVAMAMVQTPFKCLKLMFQLGLVPVCCFNMLLALLLLNTSASDFCSSVLRKFVLGAQNCGGQCVGVLSRA